MDYIREAVEEYMSNIFYHAYKEIKQNYPYINHVSASTVGDRYTQTKVESPRIKGGIIKYATCNAEPPQDYASLIIFRALSQAYRVMRKYAAVNNAKSCNYLAVSLDDNGIRFCNSYYLDDVDCPIDYDEKYISGF